ncbi:hypothetical protein ACDX78_07650 [Virgibacillus oceani]
MKTIIFLASILLFITGCSAEESSGSDNNADQDSTFYESSDVIEMVVPYGAGGGSDTASRYVAEFLGEHIEGDPSVQVVNITGGGGLTGANDFAMREADGYSIFASNTAILAPYLLGREEAQFDMDDWEPFLGVPLNSVMSISTTTGYEEPKDLLEFEEEELPVGIHDPIGSIRQILQLEFLGITDKLNFVQGYDGGGELMAALERGEISLDSQAETTYFDSIVPMEESGATIPLFQNGYLNEEGNFEGNPDIDAPTMQELYKEMYGEEPSGPIWDANLLFNGSLTQVYRVFYVHKDTPEEVIEILKEAAQEAIQDQEFIDGAINALGTEDLLAGEQLENALKQQEENMRPEVLQFVQELFTDKYDVPGLGSNE